MVASLVVTVKASQSKSDHKDREHFKQTSICFGPELYQRQLVIIKDLYSNYYKDKDALILCYTQIIQYTCTNLHFHIISVIMYTTQVCVIFF